MKAISSSDGDPITCRKRKTQNGAARGVSAHQGPRARALQRHHASLLGSPSASRSRTRPRALSIDSAHGGKTHGGTLSNRGPKSPLDSAAQQPRESSPRQHCSQRRRPQLSVDCTRTSSRAPACPRPPSCATALVFSSFRTAEAIYKETCACHRVTLLTLVMRLIWWR